MLKICRRILVSSAKNRIIDPITHSCMSFMKMIKSSGPKTVPWGTPLRMIAAREDTPSSTTRCSRSDKNDSIHFTKLRWNPILSIFRSNRRWSTLSNAFAKSKYMASVSAFLTKPWTMSSTWLSSWVRQLLPDRNPCWLSQRSWFFSMKSTMFFLSTRS